MALRRKRGEEILDYSARAYAQLQDRPVPELIRWPRVFPSPQHARRDKAVILGGVFLAANTLAGLYNAQIDGSVSLTTDEQAELREEWINIRSIADKAIGELGGKKQD